MPLELLLKVCARLCRLLMRRFCTSSTWRVLFAGTDSSSGYSRANAPRDCSDIYLFETNCLC